MTTSDETRTRTLLVGVHDESELVVSGVERMLGNRAQVTSYASAAVPGADEVDVVLCDPAGRAVPPEAYVAALVNRTRAPVVVFSWQHDAVAVRRARSAGAAAYVAKSATSDQLAETLVAVCRGERVGLGLADEPTPLLSARESDVLSLICRGHSNREIATELFVSVNSVKTYIRQIYQKIGVTRRAQAVGWGLEHGY